MNWKAIVRTDRRLYAFDAVSLTEQAVAPDPISSVDAKSSVRVAVEESCIIVHAEVKIQRIMGILEHQLQ